MRLAIIGGRDFADYSLLSNTIFQYFRDEDLFIFNEVVSGGAIGADSLGAKFAKENGIKLTVFKPEYDKYPGKIAPLKRNETIIENADFVLAFHDGISTGTLNALSHARRLKKATLIIYY